MASHEKTDPLKDARSVALEGLTRVLFKARPLDTFFDELSAPLKREDKAFAKALLWSALRHYGAVRTLLDTELMEHALPERARRADLLLVIGLTELLIVKAAPHAAVSQAVALAKNAKESNRYAGLVNAILRRVTRSIDEMITKLEALKSDRLPEWLKDRFVERFGEETAQNLAGALSDVPPLDLATKTEKAAETLATLPNAVRLGSTSIRLSAQDPRTVPGFDQGDFWVQDAAAQLAVTVLGVKTKDRVLDLCAAPGGKTMQLSALGAHVTALDRSKPRVARLKDNMLRTGLTAEIVVGDGTKWSSETLFDHILLDAPCTALGTFRRNPDILHLRAESDIDAVLGVQSKLLDHALSLLKPGGHLVYAVCSTEQEEGAAQIKDLLNRRSDVEISPITKAETGLTPPEYSSFDVSDMITADGFLTPRPDMLRDLPEGLCGLDGFFIARLIKKAA